jgi:hypothetical protein
MTPFTEEQLAAIRRHGARRLWIDFAAALKHDERVKELAREDPQAWSQMMNDLAQRAE